MAKGADTANAAAAGRRAGALALSAVVVLLVAGHIRWPDGNWSEAAYLAVVVGAGIVALAGAWRDRPNRAAWLWVAGGVTLSALGDIAYSAYVHLRGFEPDISVADVPWLLSYAALGTGLFLLLRSGRSRVDIDALLDMATVGVLALLLVWQVTIADTLADTSSPLAARLVWAAYPVCDAVLLALVVRAAASRRTRSPATLCLAGGVAAWLIADFLYMVDPYTAWWPWLDAGWMVGAALMGAACWMPRPQPAPAHERRRWPAVNRIALAVAPLLVPGIIEIIGYAEGVDPDPVPLFVASVALCALLAVRTVRIMRSGQQVETELRVTEEHFEALVQRSSDAALVLDRDGTIRYASPAAIERFGYRAEDLVGKPGWELIHPEDLSHVFLSFAEVTDQPGAHVTAELRVRDGQGGWRWVEQVLTNLLDEPAVRGLVANIRDISARKEAEQELERLALYDELTGLPNRWRVVQQLDEVRERRARVALLVIDLHQFRFVNDARGRDAGDQLLREVANRVQGTAGPDDIVSRLGGDVFAVVCPSVRQWAKVADRAALVHAALADAIDLPGHGRFHVSACIGMALTDDHRAGDDLLQQAETAMHAAKALGAGTTIAYDEQLRREVQDRVDVEEELRRALRNDELVVHYQPVIDVASGAIDGVEALVRWHHPERGVLLPGSFIPIAESSTLIERVGDLVLRQACRDAAWWARAGHELSVAVNVSANQLCHEQLAETVRTVLYETGLPAQLLVLEVTETALLSGADWALANVETLRAMGVHVALDDFGTGYSSLAYLKDLPADIVKIDRSFVAGVIESGIDRDIVEAVLQLARALGRTVVAEGVETEAQYEALQRLGCPLAQGFLWSPAMPAEDLLRRVEDEARTPSHT